MAAVSEAAKAHARDKAREWARANPERARARTAAWRLKHPERFVEYYKRYALKHAEKERARRIEWKRANRATVRANTRARQARLLKAMPAWVDAAKITGMYVAAQMMARSYGGKWEVDHIIPLRGKTVSGLHVPWNLRICRAAENRAKSNKVNLNDLNSTYLWWLQHGQGRG